MADSAILEPPPSLFSSSSTPDHFSDLHFDGDLRFSIDDVQFSIDDLFNFPDSDTPSGNSSSSTSPNVDASDLPDSKPWDLKRKNEAERDGEGEGSPSQTLEERSCKIRRSGVGDEADESCLFQSGSEEEEKRKARLMRNRESAQLSRQRKKHYVEELEEKVRSMHSTIADLNSRIGFFMAENARLRQQLGKCPPQGPCVPSIAPVPFPWFPGYAVRPSGAQVPLVAIPRLKSQKGTPEAASGRSRRSEGRKGDSKVKKLASVSLLGLFFVLVFGVFDLGNRRIDSVSSSYHNDALSRQVGGRVLLVPGDSVRSNDGVRNGFRCGNASCGKDDGNPSLREGQSPDARENASEPLVASLYIPRNNRLVKVDGNLIISSVLASERAMDSLSSNVERSKSKRTIAKGQKEVDLPGKDTGVEMVSSALTVGDSGRDGMRLNVAYLKATHGQKALPAGSNDAYVESIKSRTADRHLQDWFREGLEGPIFSSGMCTEVFQFDAFQGTGNEGGIVPASSIVNSTTNQTKNSPSPSKLKNRRILYPEPMRFNDSSLNKTEGNFSRSREDGTTHDATMGKSMIVSVLIDPREVGDASDIDGMMPPKTISRIFVVVLADGVKYVTYSCVLPFKSHSQHLVTT